MRPTSILIADDDPQERQEVVRLLAGLGHTIVGEAVSATQALALARHFRPDIMVINAALSAGSGLTIARTLAEEQIAPVLLVSGDNAEDFLDRLDTSGAMAYLSFPLREGDLQPTIALAIARWRRLVELESEVRDLNERMEARRLVGRAKAILMERHSLSERDAFRRIQGQSVALGRPVHEIARAIITASEVSG